MIRVAYSSIRKASERKFLLLWKRRINFLNPKIKIWILICCPYSFPKRSSGWKLIKYQANSSCVIISVILMTTLFYKALILQGEIWCWLLLGLKGLSKISKRMLNILKEFPSTLLYQWFAKPIYSTS